MKRPERRSQARPAPLFSRGAGFFARSASPCVESVWLVRSSTWSLALAFPLGRSRGCGFRNLPQSGRLCHTGRGRELQRSGFLEAITDAIQRLDHVEGVVHRLELLAQTLDVAVDRAVIHIDLVVVSGIHQRVAALDHARPAGQGLEDEEFGDREGDGIALPGAGMAL